MRGVILPQDLPLHLATPKIIDGYLSVDTANLAWVGFTDGKVAVKLSIPTESGPREITMALACDEVALGYPSFDPLAPFGACGSKLG
jgi:hypothetical protein